MLNHVGQRVAAVKQSLFDVLPADPLGLVPVGCAFEALGSRSGEGCHGDDDDDRSGDGELPGPLRRTAVTPRGTRVVECAGGKPE